MGGGAAVAGAGWWHIVAPVGFSTAVAFLTVRALKLILYHFSSNFVLNM